MVMCESVFKVLIIGDQYVGKTSMVARYCLNKWLASYKATIGGGRICSDVKHAQPCVTLFNVVLPQRCPS